MLSLGSIYLNKFVSLSKWALSLAAFIEKKKILLDSVIRNSLFSFVKETIFLQTLILSSLYPIISITKINYIPTVWHVFLSRFFLPLLYLPPTPDSFINCSSLLFFSRLDIFLLSNLLSFSLSSFTYYFPSLFIPFYLIFLSHYFSIFFSYFVFSFFSS